MKAPDFKLKAALKTQDASKEAFTVLIVAASCQSNQGQNKSLVEINGEYLLDREIRIIREVWPLVDIIVLLGHQAPEIMAKVKSKVRFIAVENFQNNSILTNIGIGLHASLGDSVLILLGNLVLNKETLNIPTNKTSVVIDTQKRLPKDSVGATYTKSAHIFSYGLPHKWSGIAFFAKETLGGLKELAWGERANFQLIHEAFNTLLENEHVIHTIEPPLMQLSSIETNEDINKVKQLW